MKISKCISLITINSLFPPSLLINLKGNDDRIILDKTLTDQVSIWKNIRGLTDKVVLDHDCSGETCTYYRIGDVFVCEKTGQVHDMKH